MRAALQLGARYRVALSGLALTVSGCTTLGPMPAMTALPSAPLERPGVELQAAMVPGYYLSSAVQEEPKAAQIRQLGGLLEPDELIHLPGLVLGARYAGDASAGAALEPLLGYRGYLDRRRLLSLGALGFGSYARGHDSGASFHAARGGLELGLDLRLTPPSHYVELHSGLGATFTLLDARGSYCLGEGSAYGVDCPDEPAPGQLVSAHASGLYPSLHAGLSLDFGRHLQRPFHGGRLGLDAAGGTLPTVRSAEQGGARPYAALGLSLSVGFGYSQRSADPSAR